MPCSTPRPPEPTSALSAPTRSGHPPAYTGPPVSRQCPGPVLPRGCPPGIARPCRVHCRRARHAAAAFCLKEGPHEADCSCRGVPGRRCRCCSLRRRRCSRCAERSGRRKHDVGVGDPSSGTVDVEISGDRDAGAEVDFTRVSDDLRRGVLHPRPRRWPATRLRPRHVRRLHRHLSQPERQPADPTRGIHPVSAADIAWGSAVRTAVSRVRCGRRAPLPRWVTGWRRTPLVSRPVVRVSRARPVRPSA